MCEREFENENQIIIPLNNINSYSVVNVINNNNLKNMTNSARKDKNSQSC